MAKSPSKAGTPLTPEQFLMQWKDATHKFQLNVWNFEAKAGKAVQEDFQKSFDMKRFNSNSGSAWASRSASSKAMHPLMVETGSLKKSITWKHAGSGVGDTYGAVVYTDPDGFSHTNSHQGFCYAAVHNGPSMYRQGRVRHMPRRQFIGYSTEAKSSLMKLSPEIFNGFPK